MSQPATAISAATPQADALARIADTANEAELLELAHHATAHEVEKLVRAYRRVEGQSSRSAERGQAMARHAERELNYFHDEDGSLVIRARLPAEQGAIVLQALNAAMDAESEAEASNAETDVTAVTSADADRFAQRRADALTAMAETVLRRGPELQSSAERYQVVVHVTAETLAAGEGGRCAPGTRAAAFRAAPNTVSSTPITSATGPTAAKPRSTTWCHCAGGISGWCTKAGSRSSASWRETCDSRGPTAVS